MFKQIFENKIGEKLNTFNNSGKAAFEWVDKFRQSLDISEKIEKIQQLNTNLLSQSDSGTPQISPISTENSKSESNYFYEKVTNPANSNAKGRRLSTGHGPEIEHSVTNFTETNDNSSALVASASYRQSFKGKKQSTINCSGSGHLQSPNFQINKSTDSGGSTNDFSLSSSSSISQKSTEFNTNANHTHLHQSNSINEETVVNYESRKTNSSKTLIRQSTDLTSSFPLKSFQKINSQTVEIPGLNVKVVRYRIENDLGKIEPHLYTKYSSAGIETNQVISKGKIYLTLRYNEEIRSFSVTVNKVDIYPNAKGNFMPNNFNSLHVSSNSRSQPNSPNLSKPDTYVKIVLLPDKKKKYQTKIQRKTMQPVFEETFYFQLPYEELNSKTLHLTLLEFGRFSRHELIGSVRISDLNLIKNLQASDVEIVKNILPLAEVIFISILNKSINSIAFFVSNQIGVNFQNLKFCIFLSKKVFFRKIFLFFRFSSESK